MTDFYVSIGNSDNRLDQARWSRFCEEFEIIITRFSRQIYGIWYTLPNSMFQGMCIGMKLDNDYSIGSFRKSLTELAERYEQDSIAVTLASITDFVGPHANDGFNRIDNPHG